MSYSHKLVAATLLSYNHLLWAVDYIENNAKCLSEWLPLSEFIAVQYDYWQDESWFPDESEIEEMELMTFMK